jgi:outer membrane protein insertion porin family
MFNRISSALLAALILAAPAALAANFRIADIRIEGLQRVSAGSVFNAVPVNVGDTVTDSGIRQIIREVFKTGSFIDVSVGRDGNVLVISLEERPSIDSINIEGNKAIETEALLEGLEGSGLAEGQIFKQVTLAQIGQDLERQYVSQGRYGANIETEVVDLPRNRVSLKINVNEGKVAGIKHINIIGNTVFSDDDLKDMLELQLPSLFSFYTKDDKYSREKLSGDLEKLESWYLDRGYINFNIDSTQVSISPNKEDIYITINLTEGNPFTVTGVEIAGELHEIPKQTIRAMLLTGEGQIYSRQLMTLSEERIERALGNSGYTFASATGQPVVDAEDDTVKVKFFVDAGSRAYVRRINFKGNTVTQDEVLRREMRQMEAAWASTAAIEGSKVRLERLGFFREVNVETPSVPGSEDQIDVEYTVEEQPSGSISATFGYAQGTGLILGLNYSESNVLGSGNQVSLGVSRSDFQTAYNFSFFDPYYTVDGVSRGYSIFFRESDFDEFNVARFSTNTYGASVNFGYPLSELSRINFSFGYENTDIKEGIIPAQEISHFLDTEGNLFDIYTLTTTYSMSALNRGLLPTGGKSQNLSLEVAIPGSDLSYYRLSYTGQIFFPLSRALTLRFRTDLGYGGVYGDTSTYPFYKNFFAGGLGSVRGYKRNELGPKTTPAVGDVFGENDPIGGNVLVEAGIELIFPLPFVEDQRSIKSAFFVDGGNVYNSDCQDFSTFCDDLDFGDIRYSTGVTVTWITGFAPMTFSLGYPLNDQDGDDTEIFQFELGRTF